MSENETDEMWKGGTGLQKKLQRILCVACLLMGTLPVLSGCAIEKTNRTKVRDLDYHIVAETEIPEEEPVEAPTDESTDEQTEDAEEQVKTDSERIPKSRVQVESSVDVDKPGVYPVYYYYAEENGNYTYEAKEVLYVVVE